MSQRSVESVVAGSLDDWGGLFPPGLLARLHGCRFLTGCRGGQVTLPVLQSFLVQHQYYSRNFVRYLCAVMSALPDQQAIRVLIINLIEEMGLKSDNQVTHADLFLQSMRICGAQPGSAPMHEATGRLVETMFRYCRSGDPLLALSALCLGAEAIVPIVYGPIAQALRTAGIPQEGVYFFDLHVEEDEAHALVMRSQIEGLVRHDPSCLGIVHRVATEMVVRRIEMVEAVYEIAAVPG